MTRRPIILILSTLAVALILAPTSSAGPPAGLSSSGRALWNFEALLHDTFGSQRVCVDNGFDFSAKQCSLGGISEYFYVFVGPRHSAFHLAKHRRQIRQVGHPYPIRVSGYFVACGPRERTFLFGLGESVNLALGCLVPQ